jgi:branched-chain amino acid aminotransferase
VKPLALVLDGGLIAPDRAAFLPSERGLLYGDGLFETMAVEQGTAVDAERHAERLIASCRALGLSEPATETWEQSLARCLAAAGPEAGAVRVTWTRGHGTVRGYAPASQDGPPRLLVAAYPAAPVRDDGVRAALLTGLSPGDLARHKTLSAMVYVVAAARAHAQGADEAILVDGEGHVLEAGGSNVFAVRRGRAVTPPLTRPILPGLTRARILAELPASEEELPAAKLARSEELFLTNAVAGVVPVVALDGNPIGDGTPGPMTRGLIERARAWRLEGLEG